MATTKIKTRFQQKHDIEANWLKATAFIPLQGELIIYDIEVDEAGETLDLTGTGRTTPYTYERFKIGDGKTLVSSLPFADKAAKDYADSKVPSSRKINSKDLSGDITLTAADVGAAASSHGTHVSYSNTDPVMDGDASAGSANTVARSDHRHPTDTSRASASDLTSHTGNTTVHITTDERTKWNTHADSAHAPSNAEKNVQSDWNVTDTSSDAFIKNKPNVIVEGDSRLTDSRTPVAHNQAANTITAMTGYSKASSASAISTTDSLNTAIGKLEKALDGKAASSHGTHVTYATTTPNANGTAAVGTSSKVAREDHVHPLQTSVANATKATQDASGNVITSTYATKTELENGLKDKLATTLKGTSNGLAELDANGKVPSSQLPSYVDDVIEGTYTANATTPVGEVGKIYVDTSTNKTFRWSGSKYVEISASLALGETSSTAYRGDRGKTAYEHSQATHAPSNAEKNQNAFSNITVGSTTIAAETTTDTLTLIAGSNVTITPDATNDKITIAANYSAATTSAAGLMSAADKTKLNNLDMNRLGTLGTNHVYVDTTEHSIDVFGEKSATLSQSNANGAVYITLEDGKATYEAEQHDFKGVVNFSDAEIPTLKVGALSEPWPNISAAALPNLSGKTLVFDTNITPTFGDTNTLYTLFAGSYSIVADVVLVDTTPFTTIFIVNETTGSQTNFYDSYQGWLMSSFVLPDDFMAGDGDAKDDYYNPTLLNSFSSLMSGTAGSLELNGSPVATQKWVNENVSGGSADTSNCVTLDGVQTITGAKSFNNLTMIAATAGDDEYFIKAAVQDDYDANGGASPGFFVKQNNGEASGFFKLPELENEVKTLATQEWVNENVSGGGGSVDATNIIEIEVSGGATSGYLDFSTQEQIAANPEQFVFVAKFMEGSTVVETAFLYYDNCAMNTFYYTSEKYRVYFCNQSEPVWYLETKEHNVVDTSQFVTINGDDTINGSKSFSSYTQFNNGMRVYGQPIYIGAGTGQISASDTDLLLSSCMDDGGTVRINANGAYFNDFKIMTADDFTYEGNVLTIKLS